MSMPADTPADVKIAVVNDAAIALHLNRRVDRRQQLERRPVRRRAFPLEQPDLREQERAGADRRHLTRAAGGLPDPGQRRLVVQQRASPEAARHDEDVDRRRIGPGIAAARHASPPIAVIVSRLRATVKVSNGALSSVRRESAPATVRVRENTSNGPAKSSTSTSSKMRMPTASRGPLLICSLLCFPLVLPILPIAPHLPYPPYLPHPPYPLYPTLFVMRMKWAGFVSSGSSNGSVPSSTKPSER